MNINIKIYISRFQFQMFECTSTDCLLSVYIYIYIYIYIHTYIHTHTHTHTHTHIYIAGTSKKKKCFTKVIIIMPLSYENIICESSSSVQNVQFLKWFTKAFPRYANVNRKLGIVTFECSLNVLKHVATFKKCNRTLREDLTETFRELSLLDVFS